MLEVNINEIIDIHTCPDCEVELQPNGAGCFICPICSFQVGGCID